MTEISDIWGLEYALDNKATLEHEHHIRSVAGLKEGLEGKAEANHDHAISTADSPGFMSTADRIKLDALTHGGSGASTIAGVTGLQAALDDKATSGHTHTISNIAGLQPTLDGKAGADTVTGLIAGLQTAIDGKATSGHTHTAATPSALGFMSAADKTKLDGLSTNSGASTIAQVTGLQAALDDKAAAGHSHIGLANLNPQELPYAASQSSTYGSTPAGTYASFTDGSFTTGTGTNSNPSAWIKADLGAIKAISAIWIGGGSIPNGWGTAAGYLNGASLEVSLDGTNWAIALQSLDQITDTAVTRFGFGGLLARYVRIRRNNNFIGAGEFRIFG